MMYRQTDERWNKELMTMPEDLARLTQREKDIRWGYHDKAPQGDTIGRFGCLITALTNCYNYYNKTKKTPSYFNEQMREKNGYFALYYGYDCPVERESYIVWDVAQKVFGIKYVKMEVAKNLIDIGSITKYYIARVPYKPPKIMSGHYNTVINYEHKLVYHHDSDTGVIRNDWNDDGSYWIIEIGF